ncbi:hypothetical protein ACLI4Y_01005 [Natrialbaceae archaeon A-CW3]
MFMYPLQVADGTSVRVLVLSVLALVAFAVIGGIVARDASSRRMNNPAAWGVAVFVAFFFGTIYAGLYGGLAAGGLLIVLYVAVRE